MGPNQTAPGSTLFIENSFKTLKQTAEAGIGALMVNLEKFQPRLAPRL